LNNPWRETATGVLLRIKVQPKSRRPGLHGLVEAVDGPRLKLAVAEAPEEGRANRAVSAVLAEALGVPASAVRVVQGATSREKTVAVAGEPAGIIRRLEALA
jgi:uncharacterized protein (TIGR00251 family)